MLPGIALPNTVLAILDRLTLVADFGFAVFKGKSTMRVSGATAQVFEAKKDGLMNGKVAQVEIQEIVYVIAVGTDGFVKSVIRDGSALEPSDWAALSFVEEIRKNLIPHP